MIYISLKICNVDICLQSQYALWRFRKYFYYRKGKTILSIKEKIFLL